MGTFLFGNRDHECFLSALANLVALEFGDRATAQHIQGTARNHPLIAPNGTTLKLTWPRIVADVTRGQYEGTLYLGGELEDYLRINGGWEVSGLDPASYVRLARGLVEEGRIMTEWSDEIPGRPGIFGVPSHAIAVCSNDLIIDNGFGRGVDISGYDIREILKVKPTGKGYLH